MNLNNLIRQNIKQMIGYSSAREEYQSTEAEMVLIDANENPYNTDLNRYPDPQQKLLKKQIAALKNIDAEQLLLGNGSDEVLDLIFRSFCEPNQDNIIINNPTYGMYEVLANINSIEIIKVELSVNFKINTNLLLDKIDKYTKLIFICSPNNPSGNTIDSGEINKLLKHFKGLVIIDEAYIDFSSQKSWSTQLDAYPNLIVLQTLSKAYGLAGIRLGYCMASREIIRVLNKIKPPYNINTLTQKAALDCLYNPTNYRKQLEEILEQRSWLIAELSHIPIVKELYPTEANFVLVKVDDANRRYKQLLKHKIIVRNRTKETNCKNCLRITIGTEQENKQLVKILKKLK